MAGSAYGFPGTDAKRLTGDRARTRDGVGGHFEEVSPRSGPRTIEAPDRHGQRQQEDQMAKKSKKGKKAKKAKKAVVAKKAKKSAKKASKKAAKKSAKKAAKKGAKKSAKKAAKKSKAAAPKKAAKKSAAKKRKAAAEARRLPRRSPRWRRQNRSPRRHRRRAGLPPSRPRPHGGPARPTAAITTRRSPAGHKVSRGRSVHRCGLFREGLFPSDRSRIFTGRLIRKGRRPAWSPVLLFPIPLVAPTA